MNVYIDIILELKVYVHKQYVMVSGQNKKHKNEVMCIRTLKYENMFLHISRKFIFF